MTSGPGVTNLVTALATANCEGDPVVALGGNSPLSQRYKRTHQASPASAAPQGCGVGWGGVWWGMGGRVWDGI